MGPSVWILADGKPRRVPVTLGITDGSSTEIVSGELKDGDPVITELTPAAAAAQARTQRPGMGRMF
jgi:HlyD family secretion protein